MSIITQYYKKQSKEIMVEDIMRMMKIFKYVMKQKFIIPPTSIEKYKNGIFFMVKIDATCM